MLADMTATDSLREHFTKSFGLPNAATEWLLMLWQAIQVFDDVADGDTVDRSELNATIWNTLVGMHQNAFWHAHAASLAPVVSVMILKWQASDTAERAGNADARSYAWRAGYYDVVLLVVQLCHGAEATTKVAHHVMALYGENLQDYMKEFDHA